METHDAFGLRTENRFLLVTDKVTYTLYIRSVISPFHLNKQEIHGEQKFPEVSIVLLSHGIGAQLQQLHEVRVGERE